VIGEEESGVQLLGDDLHVARKKWKRFEGVEGKSV
jgi:hypothetical protein